MVSLYFDDIDDWDVHLDVYQLANTNVLFKTRVMILSKKTFTLFFKYKMGKFISDIEKDTFYFTYTKVRERVILLDIKRYISLQSMECGITNDINTFISTNSSSSKNIVANKTTQLQYWSHQKGRPANYYFIITFYNQTNSSLEIFSPMGGCIQYKGHTPATKINRLGTLGL